MLHPHPRERPTSTRQQAARVHNPHSRDRAQGIEVHGRARSRTNCPGSPERTSHNRGTIPIEQKASTCTGTPARQSTPGGTKVTHPHPRERPTSTRQQAARVHNPQSRDRAQGIEVHGRARSRTHARDRQSAQATIEGQSESSKRHRLARARPLAKARPGAPGCFTRIRGNDQLAQGSKLHGCTTHIRGIEHKASRCTGAPARELMARDSQNPQATIEGHSKWSKRHRGTIQ